MSSGPLVPRPSSPRDEPRWQETLRDGRRVVIRPIQPTDRTRPDPQDPRQNEHRLVLQSPVAPPL